MELPITAEAIRATSPQAKEVVHVSKEGAEFCGVFATEREAIRYIVNHVLDELDERPLDQMTLEIIRELVDEGRTGGRSSRWFMSPVGATLGEAIDYDRFDDLYDEFQAGRAVSALLAEAESSSGEDMELASPETPPPRRRAPAKGRAPRTPYRPIF